MLHGGGKMGHSKHRTSGMPNKNFTGPKGGKKVRRKGKGLTRKQRRRRRGSHVEQVRGGGLMNIETLTNTLEAQGVGNEHLEVDWERWITTQGQAPVIVTSVGWPVVRALVLDLLHQIHGFRADEEGRIAELEAEVADLEGELEAVREERDELSRKLHPE